MSKCRVGKITWFDAREMDAELETIEAIEKSKDGQEYLVIKETFGEIRELPNVYIITTEKDNTGTETITVIPKSWLVEVE
jgi:hypothetical protein